VVMQGLGSAYLLWLAWMIGTSGAPRSAESYSSPVGFLGAFLLTWLSPKAWTIVIAAAATFANLTSSATSLAILMALAFGLAGAFSASVWCIGGLLLSRRLTTERQWQAVNAALATVLVLCIVRLWL